MDEKTITLRKPVHITDDLVCTELKLREPVARELEQAGPSNVLLISLVAGIPRIVAEQLSARDYIEASGYLNGFLSTGPAIG